MMQWGYLVMISYYLKHNVLISNTNIINISINVIFNRHK